MIEMNTIYKVTNDKLFALISELPKYKDHILVCVRNITYPEVEESLMDLELFNEQKWEDIDGNHLILPFFSEYDIDTAKVDALYYYNLFLEHDLPLCLVSNGEILETNIDFYTEYQEKWQDDEDHDDDETSEEEDVVLIGEGDKVIYKDKEYTVTSVNEENNTCELIENCRGYKIRVMNVSVDKLELIEDIKTDQETAEDTVDKGKILLGNDPDETW